MARGSRRRTRVSPEEYADFIRQIELRDIWLEHAEVDNDGPQPPERVEFEIDREATYESLEDGFLARHSYEVSVRSKDSFFADIEVRFVVRFSSPQEMTDRIFEVFEDVNLPVNTWPYLREFVSTTLGRMGWQPITLPALKRGTEAGSRATGSVAKPSRGTRQTRKKAS
jgi:preprotein translocase subunit SecB